MDKQVAVIAPTVATAIAYISAHGGNHEASEIIPYNEITRLRGWEGDIVCVEDWDNLEGTVKAEVGTWMFKHPERDPRRQG